jgi:hypothetical protein
MAVLFLVLAGCQHFDRARECRALADGVNPELKVLSGSFTDHDPVSAEELNSAGQLYAKAASRLASIHFKEVETASLAAQMKDNLTALARSCDRLAMKFKQTEPEDPQLRRELESQYQRHGAIVSSIERTCRE